jgi:hypothetical protein
MSKRAVNKLLPFTDAKGFPILIRQGEIKSVRPSGAFDPAKPETIIEYGANGLVFVQGTPAETIARVTHA